MEQLKAWRNTLLFVGVIMLFPAWLAAIACVIAGTGLAIILAVSKKRADKSKEQWNQKVEEHAAIKRGEVPGVVSIQQGRRK